MKKLLFIFIIIFKIQSQWSNDPTINNPIRTGVGDQHNPSIVSDDQGDKIIVYEDRDQYYYYNIFAQKISSNGTIKWTANGVTIFIAYNEKYYHNPKVVSDGFGGAIIVWRDYRNGNWDIYAQRVDSNGKTRWLSNGMPICALASQQEDPELISDGLGGAIITWEDFRNKYKYAIYAQRINSNGTFAWAQDGVPICLTTNNNFYPKIINDGLGNAIITWEDGRGITTDGGYRMDIYAQKIDTNGIIKWDSNGVAICSAIYNQKNPVIVSDGSGGAYITWLDERSSYNDIYIQRIDSKGVVKWDSNGIGICIGNNTQQNPNIINDSNGGVIIIWEDNRKDNWDVYAQKIDSKGILKWIVNGVTICPAINAQKNSKIVSDDSGGAIITWEDYRSGVGDIYIQKINSNGIVRWNPNGVSICSKIAAQRFPAIISDDSGGAIIAWQDYRNGDWDIYASRLFESSLPLLKSNYFTIKKKNVNIVINGNYPNPFNSETVINYQIPTSGIVKIKIYNLLGEELQEILNEEQTEGVHEIRYNASHLTTGIYYYKIIQNEKSELKKFILMK